MKITESQLRGIIKESLEKILYEQSQSWWEYVNGNNLRPSNDEIKTINDKMMNRGRNRYNDGGKQYQWSNPIAKDIYRGANAGNINDISKNAKRETSTSDLHKMNGEDPLYNWDYVPGTEHPMKINGSKMNRAKDAYITKHMTPEEKEQYYKEKYKGRYNTFYNEFGH